jgi:hypothetical protein
MKMTSRTLRRVDRQKLTDVPEVHTASIIDLMMETINIS